MTLRAVLLLCAVACRPAAADDAPARVFAAASLTVALDAIAADWQRAGHAAPQLTFAGSSALARQIEAGAPADLYASADVRWMDHVQQAGRIDPATRVDLVGNRLVLIAPAGRGFALTLADGVDLAGAFDGKLCTGEPDAVPVGTYAKQALTALHAWDAVEARIVGTEDARAALAFVERGECAAGIVYATDAAGSDAVEVVAEFPAASHAPIVYPFALLRDARPEARALLAHLRGSKQARATFERLGFVVLVR